MTIKMSVKVETEISDDQISALLCTAFEGGSNYWYTQLDHDLPEGIPFADFCEGGKRQPEGGYWHWSQLIPLVEGCALTLVDQEDGETHRITRKDIEAGLKIFAEKYPQHFTDWINENDDAITGDVFLRCVVFGEDD